MLRHLFSMVLPIALCGALVAGCGEEEGSPLMNPGDNCMTCHNGSKAPKWTVAGTVYSSPTDTALMGVSGVTVIITDATGKKETLTSNAAGNFYTKAALTFPISAELQRGTKSEMMGMKVSTGACASCHNQPAAGGAPGRLYIAP